MCSIQKFVSPYDPQGQVVGAWKALVTSLLTIGYGGGAVGLQLHSGTQVETLVMMGLCCVCAVCTYDICPSSKTHEEEIGAAKTSERMWTIWDVIISSALMPPPRLTLSPSHFTRAMFALSHTSLAQCSHYHTLHSRNVLIITVCRRSTDGWTLLGEILQWWECHRLRSWICVLWEQAAWCTTSSSIEGQKWFLHCKPFTIHVLSDYT